MFLAGSRDFYEGMRPADPADLAAIAELLAPLEAEGILAPRSRAQLEADLPHFVVAEREAKVGVTVSCIFHLSSWHLTKSPKL